MNMTGLIHWCEGRTRCPLLSSRQSGYCLPHSLTPRCHQLARAQVSLRHRRCCLPPSVTSLIISLRWVCYLTHRDEEENTARTHTCTARAHTQDTNAGCARQHTHPSAHLWKVAIVRDTHYKHSPCVYVHKRLHTQACLDAVDLSTLERLLFR